MLTDNCSGGYGNGYFHKNQKNSMQYLLLPLPHEQTVTAEQSSYKTPALCFGSIFHSLCTSVSDYTRGKAAENEDTTSLQPRSKIRT